jgi:hypothetical protein
MELVDKIYYNEKNLYKLYDKILNGELRLGFFSNASSHRINKSVKLYNNEYLLIISLSGENRLNRFNLEMYFNNKECKFVTSNLFNDRGSKIQNKLTEIYRDFLSTYYNEDFNKQRANFSYRDK